MKPTPRETKYLIDSQAGVNAEFEVRSGEDGGGDE